jgi:hypothetical protein
MWASGGGGHTWEQRLVDAWVAGHRLLVDSSSSAREPITAPEALWDPISRC